MDVGRGRVNTELYAQRLAGLRGTFQLLAQVLFADQIDRAFFQVFELFVDGHLKKDTKARTFSLALN